MRWMLMLLVACGTKSPAPDATVQNMIDGGKVYEDAKVYMDAKIYMDAMPDAP